MLCILLSMTVTQSCSYRYGSQSLILIVYFSVYTFVSRQPLRLLPLIPSSDVNALVEHSCLEQEVDILT